MIWETNIIPNIFFFQVNGTYILKSGTDFRQFSLVTLDFREVIIFSILHILVALDFQEVINFSTLQFEEFPSS